MNVTFEMKIESGNAAFGTDMDDITSEVQAILASAAARVGAFGEGFDPDRVSLGRFEWPLRDSNGNAVGSAQLTVDLDD